MFAAGALICLTGLVLVLLGVGKDRQAARRQWKDDVVLQIEGQAEDLKTFIGRYALREIQAKKISTAPCLWFNKNAEEAAEYYAKIFPDSIAKIEAARRG